MNNSKTSSLVEYQYSVIKETRVLSYINLEKNMGSRNNYLGQNYDTTIYINPIDNSEWYPYLFGKTLHHDETTCFISKSAGDKLIDAISSGTSESINNIVLSHKSRRKLEGLTTINSYNLLGNDPIMIEFPQSNFFPIDSPKMSFEMLEVYSHSLCRNIPFTSYINDNYIDNIIEILNKTPDNCITAPINANGIIESKLLFRGKGLGENIGPYISQFLLLDFKYGSINIQQKYIVELDSINGNTMESAVDIQNGVNNVRSVFEEQPKYIYNGQVLGSVVHNDPLYQFYYDAALIALQNGISSSGFKNDKTSDWTDGGPPCLLASLAEVSLGALRVAWYNKYGINMTIRPEVLSQRITLGMNSDIYKQNVPKLTNIINNIAYGSDILNLVNEYNNKFSDQNNNYLLNVQYPEGSPTHPSLPAGHAVVSGACVTVLKAMLNTNDENNKSILWPIIPKVSSNGDYLEDYTDKDSSLMTINSELNKLASNIAIGRNFAGVHYRRDGDCGIKLGEEYAISFLVDKALELHASKNNMFQGWILEKMNGEIIKITEKGVTIL